MKEICAELDWVQHNNTIAQQIRDGDIANFIQWEVIFQTMFGRAEKVPIKYFQSLPDWDKWEKAIIESPVGNPKLHKSYPLSSGYLVNQAYHLHEFLSKTKCKLENLHKILEFGAGYGCMCRLIHNLGFSGEYVIMDLPALLELQQYYLGETVNGRITFVKYEKDFIEQMSEDESLFIATWSISEISYPMRQRILDAVCTKYIFITFQEKHNKFDNKDFFDKFIKKNTKYHWQLHYIPFVNASERHCYLFGERKGEDDEIQMIQKEYLAFEQMAKSNRLEIHFFNQSIKQVERAKYDPHYILHTAWAARILARIRPEKHVDISSSMYFNTIVSAFIPVDWYEYKPFSINLSNLQIKYTDRTKLPFKDNFINSLSCMHVVEHIGLGRYGEPLDPEGDLKAIAELKRVLAKDLLFVVPLCGKPKVLFNLHRIYSYDQIIDYFKDLKLVEFALITDMGCLVEQASRELANEQEYGCGCFWFRKE